VSGPTANRTRSFRTNFGLVALCGLCLVTLWSWVEPADRLTWWLEALPALIAITLIIIFWKKFPLTGLLLSLVAIHCVILLIGAHYTYAEVPLGYWMQEWFGFTRNNYDKIGHFAQGFVPAIAAREFLLRTSPMRPGKWLFAIITLSVLGISAVYELIEWVAAITSGGAAEAFLGTQGDVWDTQSDMALALIGALTAQALLTRPHDRQLNGLPDIERAN
jgi:putative membrane protein